MNGPPQIDPSTYVIYDLSISLNPWHLWRLRFGFLEVLHGARTNGQTICAISTVQPDNHLVLLNGERMCNSEWSGLKESKESYIKTLLSNRRIVLRYMCIYTHIYILYISVYYMIFLEATWCPEVMNWEASTNSKANLHVPSARSCCFPRQFSTC